MAPGRSGFYGRGSTCACDLRELLIVPLRTQGYCGVGRGLSGLHWVSCNGRGPNLVKLDLEKAEEPEIKLPTSIGSLKKQESSRQTSTPALLTTPKPCTVWMLLLSRFSCV